MDGISDHAELRAFFGAPSHLAEIKVLDHVDHFCQRFIALSPFLVLATSDEQGNLDNSPRGDAPGFVQVIDPRTLLLPDRRGNNRVDSFHNVLSNPSVGLLFLVPGLNETLRVNGTGRMVTDETLLAPLEAQGKVPRAGLLITVREAFLHCGKAMIRSKLWDPARQVPKGTYPSIGRIIAEQTKQADPDEAERWTEEGYRDRLY